VNFTDGTPLSLREAPDFDSAEILPMPEGAEFNIIGGPACVNADLYYRFWQLQLDDSTIVGRLRRTTGLHQIAAWNASS
jgi:hypothetical protein